MSSRGVHHSAGVNSGRISGMAKEESQRTEEIETNENVATWYNHGLSKKPMPNQVSQTLLKCRSHGQWSFHGQMNVGTKLPVAHIAQDWSVRRSPQIETNPPYQIHKARPNYRGDRRATSEEVKAGHWLPLLEAHHYFQSMPIKSSRWMRTTGCRRERNTTAELFSRFSKQHQS